MHLRYLSNLPELSGELPLLGFCRPDLRTTSAGSAERKSRCRLFSNGLISSPGRSRCHWTLADSMAGIIAWEEILKSSLLSPVLPDDEKRDLGEVGVTEPFKLGKHENEVYSVMKQAQGQLMVPSQAKAVPTRWI